MTDTPPPGDSRPFPYNQLDMMLALPGLDAAVRSSVRGAVAYYDAAPVMHRNVKDVGRFLLGVLALHLDATGGLTHRRLRELSGKSGIVSAGTATAVLLRLQLIDYVSRSDAINGLSRPYRPTPTMQGAFRERMRIELQALSHLTDETAPLLARLDEAGVFAALMAMMGDQAMVAAGAPNPDLAALNALGLRSAGLLILFELICQADRGEAFPPLGEVEVSVAALARRFDVSRSHVLSVMRDIEAAGWLRRGAVDGAWTLTPTLRADVRTFYAITYLGLIRAAGMALAQVAAPSQGGGVAAA